MLQPGRHSFGLSHFAEMRSNLAILTFGLLFYRCVSYTGEPNFGVSCDMWLPCAYTNRHILNNLSQINFSNRRLLYAGKRVCMITSFQQDDRDGPRVNWIKTRFDETNFEVETVLCVCVCGVSLPSKLLKSVLLPNGQGNKLSSAVSILCILLDFSSVYLHLVESVEFLCAAVAFSHLSCCRLVLCMLSIVARKKKVPIRHITVEPHMQCIWKHRYTVLIWFNVFDDAAWNGMIY